MNVQKNRARRLVERACIVLGLSCFAWGAISSPSSAAVIGNNVSINFLGTSTSFNLGAGASYTLSGTNGDIFNPVQIATAGTALVNSLGAPFYNPPQPTSYFTDRGVVTIGPGMMFTAFPTPTTIPFSLNDTFIGLAFTSSAGTNYGYARFDGTTLLAYGYEMQVNTPIVAGSAFTAPIAQAVPEPASMALFGVGLLGLAFVRRQQRR